MMTDAKQPITIKKYANRRLYNTGTSSYVTLEDLAQMVKTGEDFVVFDAKTGEEITRSVLTQIIFEQEGKEGQNLLPITFLRQLIRFYGDSMQMLVPSYLEFSLDKLVGEQQKMREQMTNVFGSTGLPGTQILTAMEETARKNMAMFSQAMSLFGGFNAAGGKNDEGKTQSAEAASAAASAQPAAGGNDLDALKQQLLDMQKKLEALSRKG